MHDLRDAQLQYEIESDAEAQAARLNALIKASREGDVELPRAHALIGRMCGVVKERIEAFAAEKTRGMGGKYKAWLRAIPSDVAAIIAIRQCIKQCSTPDAKTHVQALASNVGKLWELEVRIRQAEKVNPLYMKRVYAQVQENGTKDQGHLRRLYNVAIQRVFKDEINFSLTATEMIQIGKFGVDACYEAGLIEQIRTQKGLVTSVQFTLADEVIDFLRSYTINDVRNVLAVEHTRMMCPPDPWTNLMDGGYLSTRRKAIAPLMNLRKMRKGVRQEIADAFTAEKMPEVFSAGNYLQSIPFMLHSATREAILRVWQSGGGVMGVPITSGPTKPPCPLPPEWVKDSGTDEERNVFQQWKRSVVAYHAELLEWRGRAREVGAFIRASNEIDGPCWFPVFFDSRGRWYYHGIPNPQGSDLARSALHFHEKRPLGARGMFWLKVAIANHYGFDKVRNAERAAWTDSNWPRISAALDEPENHTDVWGKDAPWSMFSAAWELREALRSGRPEAYETGIPIHMDATCSGLQHFSALLRDPVGGMFVNLRDTHKGSQKQDIYSRVAENTLQVIKRDIMSTDPLVSERAAWFYKVGIPRALAKKPVMTYVYGATLRGTAEHVQYMLAKDVLPELGITWRDETMVQQDCYYLARKLFQGIEAAVPAAASAMRWLRSVAQQQPNGKRMAWRTPTGFWVQHDYQDFTETQVRINSCGVVQVWVRDWNEGTRSHSMQNAISPNFVHALDSSHLTMVANAMKQEDLRIVGIHDSFGTHPCDVDRMHQHIRQEFVRLYSHPNLLGSFLWDVDGVGELPPRGDLNLLEVLDSEFMFC